MARATSSDRELPSSIDYHEQDMVTSVKDQGKCKSCYAFAAVGVLEAQNQKVNGKLVSLSAQQLVDCSGNKGCEGGTPSECFKYAKNGLATSDDYPYRGKRGECKKNKDTEVTVSSYKKIKDEEDLKKTLANHGPVAVGIHAPEDLRLLEMSEEGRKEDVYDIRSPGVGWHAVLVVGYGTTKKGVPYWIIKNSWGTEWADGGYARFRRGINIFKIGKHAHTASVTSTET